MGRPPSPGQSATQRAHAEREAERYQALPKEKRQAIVQTRDRGAQQAADARRYDRSRDQRVAAQVARDRHHRATGDDVQQRRARAIAQVALSTGRLVKPATCEVKGCNEPPTEMHHNDYNNPLDVKHVCSTHHGEADRNTEASGRG